MEELNQPPVPEKKGSAATILGTVVLVAAAGVALAFSRPETSEIVPGATGEQAPRAGEKMSGDEKAAEAPEGARMVEPAKGDSAGGSTETTSAGSYSDYDDSKVALAAGGGKVVIFFHATWCPSCRSADAAFRATSVPAGLTILKIDYDSSAELKKKYGVTSQHTFVQVDAAGNLIAKWSGANTVADVLAKVK